MKITKFDIEGPLLIEPVVHGDERGYFVETFKQKILDEALGFKIEFVQDNESLSSYGVLRGLHYQLPPFAQSKLVRVIKGSVIDIAVDIRKKSPTFGKYISVELSGENKKQLFVPRGFAHAFVVTSKEAIFAYKVDNYYSPECDRGIRYDDDTIGIDWSFLGDKPKLSAKDKALPTLQDAEVFDYGIDLYEEFK